LLNPISYAVNAPFTIVGASLPAALLSAVTYAIMTVLVVKPAGKGGYK
jgi:NCS1 family nucleobase:cation symporter-1